ncbi:MAG: radical SAM superfamily protein [Candidatus Syntrophoarchaeum caldarius]|uniref:Radical SAM superfamily protein n=1 Tax=Candidatus Syntropharchaeum caldarium TaxID=1838285 RepID=A0A1F2PCE6_9EURY|nr:MAG: radical SAM superfamily protein [Candidatus Syntrophoarchaeum caldarius]
MRYVEPVFRPPSEARSLLLQASIGCSNNTCKFCVSYKRKHFAIRTLDEIAEDIRSARSIYGEGVRRVFLLDGNALAIPTDELLHILEMLYDAFPNLERVSAYGCTQDILEKSTDELEAIRDAGLSLIYFGIESGDDAVLAAMNKGVTADETRRAGLKAIGAGFNLSATVILGLGGRARSKEHAIATGEILSEISPHYIGALTLMVPKGAPLERDIRSGKFELLSPAEILHEMRLMIECTDITGRKSLFRSNHASNYLPIGGILPDEKDEILHTIDSALSKNGAGLRPEFMRAL